MSDNIKIMTYDEADEVIEELFESLFHRYQIGLETSMWGIDFTFDCVSFLHYKCYKINLKCVGWYIDSPDWMKNKKATINPISDDDKCFQYTAKVALNHEEIGKNSQRI